MRESAANDVTGHSPNDTARLVLGDDLSAELADGFAAVKAVVSHAGHDDAERALAKHFRRRLKQHIDGRTMRRIERARVEMHNHTAIGCAAQS